MAKKSLITIMKALLKSGQWTKFVEAQKVKMEGRKLELYEELKDTTKVSEQSLYKGDRLFLIDLLEEAKETLEGVEGSEHILEYIANIITNREKAIYSNIMIDFNDDFSEHDKIRNKILLLTHLFDRPENIIQSEEVKQAEEELNQPVTELEDIMEGIN